MPTPDSLQPRPAGPSGGGPFAADDSAWSNRRILTLLALGTLVVSLVWRLPEEVAYLGERLGELMVMLTFAAAFTYLLRPPVNALCRLPMFGGVRTGSIAEGKRQKSGRTWAVIVVFLFVGGLIYLFSSICYKQVANEVRDIDMVRTFMAKSPTEKQAMFKDWRNTIKTALQPTTKQLDINAETVDKALDWMELRVKVATPYVSAWLSGMSHRLSSIVEALLLPVLVFYFLADGPAIRREAELLVPYKQRARFAHILNNFDRVFDGYVRGQIIMCIIAWVLVSALLLALHIPHWFTLGLIAGLTRAVPVIGPILGGVPLVLVSFIETRDPSIVVMLVIAFTLMHFIESKVLLPRIIGHEVDLHPVGVIIALLVGLKFFGLLGVFLSVPFAAAGKAFLAEWHETIAQREAERQVAFAAEEVTAIAPGALNARDSEAGKSVAVDLKLEDETEAMHEAPLSAAEPDLPITPPSSAPPTQRDTP